MKAVIIKFLHFIFGYDTYLKLFSIFKIQTLALDSRKSDFLFFEKLLSEQANILVVGACTGITTIPFAKKHYNRIAFAYEPLSSNYKTLNRVIAYYKLKNVNTYPIGLGNITCKKEIILPIINGVKKQGLAHIKDPTLDKYNDGITETVYIERLDDRTEVENIKIEAIKIVAENFELQVLEGAKKVIEGNKPLIYCELWHNEKRKPVLDLIKKYNYELFYRKGDQLIPYMENNYSGKNFFFKPIA